jgi:type IX secretion system PorP/SprF family membrane protein
MSLYSLIRHYTFTKLSTTTLTTCACLCFSYTTTAQQEWGYSQYFFNLFDVNSAYAGNHGNPSFAIRARRQWPGLPGSPFSQSFSIHKPLGTLPLGIGLRVFHETIGARNHWGVKMNAAYKMDVHSGTLSAGASFGIIHESLDLTRLNIRDEDDLVRLQNTWNSTLPDVDVSILYNTKRFWLGSEFSRINRSPYDWSEGSSSRLYYQISTTGGKIYRVGNDDLFQVSGLFKWSEGAIWQAEMNAALLWNDLIWIGAGYRFLFGPVFFAEWNLSSQMRLGYSYDIGVGNTLGPFGPSHELFIGFNMQGSTGRTLQFDQK